MASSGQGPWPPGTLLAGMEESARKAILELGARRQYTEAGRVLIREGDHSTSVYLLLAGWVKVTGAVDGQDALLALRVGGDVVGELAALDERPRLASVTTAGPVMARVIGRADFLGLLSRDPKLALAVTRGVSDKLRTATSRRIEFTSCNVSTRLARVLLDLAHQYGEQRPEGRKIGCPLTQTELATLAGAAEPTVQRSLRQLKADRIVAVGYREITVRDMDALRKLAFPG